MLYDTNALAYPALHPASVILNRLRPSAVLPSFGTPGAACFDLSAAFEDGLDITTYDVNNNKDKVPVNADLEFVLLPKERILVPTGWVFGIPFGYSMRLHPRSGLALKNGITLANAEGVIDEDYTLETFVMLLNMTTERFVIKNGDRICQAEIVPVFRPQFVEIETKIADTERKGGFGSTGL